MNFKTDIVMFTKYCCKLLKIDLPKINIQNGNEYTNLYGKRVRSFSIDERAIGLTTDKNIIYLNVTNIDEVTALFCLAHELRHVYQNFVLGLDSSGDYEDSETVDIWRICKRTYFKAGSDYYKNQPLEVDANAFAQVVIGNFFDKKVSIDCDQKLLDNKVKILQERYRKNG